MTQKIPVIVRISQAQTVFGVHRSTLYRWAKSQHITIHRRGAMSFVDPSEVYNFIINGEGTQWGPARKRTKFMNDINEYVSKFTDCLDFRPSEHIRSEENYKWRMVYRFSQTVAVRA